MEHATVPEGATAELARWLASTTLEDVPEAVIRRAKLVLLDALGCALIGARMPWTERAAGAVAELEGGGDVAVIGTGRALTPTGAALLNAAAIQAFELDDYHPVAPLHSGSLVVPALLSTAPGVVGGVDGATFLLGAILGFEVGPRVGLALHGAQMLTRGWHSGPVFGGPAAAAAAGTLRGLDAAAFEDALGLAATQAGGLMAAQFGAMSKRMQHGFAARNGVLAAALAAHGYTGIKGVFEVGYGGFLSTFGEGHDPDAAQICDALGERWETGRIAIKPYAAMAGLHAAIDAARALLARDAVGEAAAVRAIEVEVSRPAFEHGGWEPPRPLTPVGAQMNLAYAVAVTLLDGTALLHQFAPDRIDADDVWALIGRTTVRHQPAFDERLEDGYNCRVTVTTASGERVEAFVDHPSGGLIHPLDEAAIVDKFRTLAAVVADDARAERIERAVLALEELGDIMELVDLLAPAVDAAALEAWR